MTSRLSGMISVQMIINCNFDKLKS